MKPTPLDPKGDGSFQGPDERPSQNDITYTNCRCGACGASTSPKKSELVPYPHETKDLPKTFLSKISGLGWICFCTYWNQFPLPQPTRAPRIPPRSFHPESGELMTTYRQIFKEVDQEIQRAEKAAPPFNSGHEGYAILLEEVEELWREVQKKQFVQDSQGERVINSERAALMRKEAIQVAAMAIRFVHDLPMFRN